MQTAAGRKEVISCMFFHQYLWLYFYLVLFIALYFILLCFIFLFFILGSHPKILSNAGLLYPFFLVYSLSLLSCKCFFGGITQGASMCSPPSPRIPRAVFTVRGTSLSSFCFLEFFMHYRFSLFLLVFMLGAEMGGKPNGSYEREPWAEGGGGPSDHRGIHIDACSILTNE